MKRKYIAFIALLSVALALPAIAKLDDDDCDVPIQRWQKKDAVTQMATQKGWEIQRLKIDDGCYEIHGKTKEGELFKAKINPETLVVVKMKIKGEGHKKHDAKKRSESSKATPIKATPNATQDQQIPSTTRAWIE